MKKIQLLTLIALTTIATSFQANATIWRVNNTAEVDADFTTAQAAHNDANVMPGDTLLFEGSANTYGSIHLMKKLVLIGPGYFLGENKGHQANLNTANLSSATFGRQPAVAPTVAEPDGIDASTSQGSIILGLDVNGVTVNVPSITIRRCYVNGSVNIGSGNSVGSLSGPNYLANGNNSVIIQCYITGDINLNGADNIVASNNVLRSAGNGNTSTNITFTNNILTWGGGGNGAISLYNSTVRNNILIGSSASVTALNSTYSNNLAVFTSALPVGNGNVNGVAVADLFVGATAGSDDGFYQLLDGSVAAGAGFNGVDCGIFGGATPYVLSGIPPIPSIYEFTAPGIGTQTDGLQIQVKIKSNN